MNWARRIYVGDAYGKSVLRAIADYADEFGHCWPSLARLAQDCDLSVDSVRRRLRTLEDIGLIVTFRTWLDDNGKRNQDGKGRETSREIRLLLDVLRTRDDLESGNDNGDDGEPPLADSKGGVAGGYPSQQQGRGSRGARGGVALVPPPYEPSLNRESSPLPPPGEREGNISDDLNEEQTEPEHFLEMWESYPGREVMVRSKALAVFVAMTPEERLHARHAAPQFAESLKKLGRKTRPNCEKWLRQRGWQEFPMPDPAKPRLERKWISVGSSEYRALCAAATIAGHPLPARIEDRERGQGLWRMADVPPDLLALAIFDGAPVDNWQVLEAGSGQFAAWRDRLQQWTGRAIEPRRIFVEDHDPAIHDLPGSHPDFRLRKSVMGVRVPVPWPPRKDGTMGEGDPSPDGPIMDDDDSAALAGEMTR